MRSIGYYSMDSIFNFLTYIFSSIFNALLTPAYIEALSTLFWPAILLFFIIIFKTEISQKLQNLTDVKDLLKFNPPEQNRHGKDDGEAHHLGEGTFTSQRASELKETIETLPKHIQEYITTRGLNFAKEHTAKPNKTEKDLATRTILLGSIHISEKAFRSMFGSQFQLLEALYLDTSHKLSIDNVEQRYFAIHTKRLGSKAKHNATLESWLNYLVGYNLIIIENSIVSLTNDGELFMIYARQQDFQSQSKVL